MKIFYSLNDFLKSRASSGRFAVTIGVFDGVHRAHRRVIKTVIKKAKAKHLSTLLITFNPHPANALIAPRKVPLLISLKHRLRLLREAGIENVLILHFDRKFREMPAADFIKKVLCKIKLGEITIGENFRFGKGQLGTLRNLEEHGYTVDVVKTLKRSGLPVSSTRIRGLILSGNLKKAEKLLSASVVVLGTVIKGHMRGRIIGFPTANINPHHEAIPPSGVYAVKIKRKNRSYKGILNIGIRPTFTKSHSAPVDPTIEVHLFDFNKPLYGEDLEIIFVKKIREEKKFKDACALKEQIKKDENRARRLLGRH